MVDTIARPPSEAEYDSDFYAWTQAQAAALRAAAAAGANLAIDWENVAEEIESLGKSDVSAIKSRMRTIIEHLLKLEFSPALDPTSSWQETVTRTRIDIEDLLAESPSLRPRVATLIDTAASAAAKVVMLNLRRHRELTREVEAAVRGRRYTQDEVLGDWYPNRRDPNAPAGP